MTKTEIAARVRFAISYQGRATDVFSFVVDEARGDGLKVTRATEDKIVSEIAAQRILVAA